MNPTQIRAHLDLHPPAARWQRYGSVEIVLSPLFDYGEVIAVPPQIRLEIVDTVDRADGIVILGTVAPEDDRIHLRPATLCVLFSHYVRCDGLDNVDYDETQCSLERPDAQTQALCEMVITRRLRERSPAAGFAFTPIIRYL